MKEATREKDMDNEVGEGAFITQQHIAALKLW